MSRDPLVEAVLVLDDEATSTEEGLPLPNKPIMNKADVRISTYSTTRREMVTPSI